MLVPKADTDQQRKKFKKFKKLNLQLYQKNYRLYENEFIILNKPKSTNRVLLNHIGERLRISEEPPKQYKGLMAQISLRSPDELSEKNFFKRYDYNYNHCVNLPIDESWSFHLNTNLQSKNDFGLFTMTPSFSYHTPQSYYRAGLTWGPQTDFYIMAMKQLTPNMTVGMLASFLQKNNFSKDKYVVSMRYRNFLTYTSIGSYNTFGIRAYPALYSNFKFYVNPYVVRGEKGCVAGISRKLTDLSSVKLEFTYTDWLIGVKSAFQLKINNWTKLYFNCELQNRSVYFGMGMKLKHFYFGIPLLSTGALTTDDIKWLAPVVLGISFLAMKWDKIKAKFFGGAKEKLESEMTFLEKHEKRQKDLKLIARRVKEIYNDEVRKNGLIILEAYYGSRKCIDELRVLDQADKIKTLLTEPYASKVLDVTDSMRFYVEDSKLVIPKRTKGKMYGVFVPLISLEEELVLYIRYKFQGQEKEAMVLDSDEAILPM